VVSPQIIAIGGLGLPTVADTSALCRYVLARTRKRNPSICFLGTATGDAESSLVRFYAAFPADRCQRSHVSLFSRTTDLKQALLTQDVIYVGGGNTKSMLAVWREWGIPSLLRKAWKSGIVLAGVSAGAICWFQAGITDSWADRLNPLPCLGFLPGTCCPHFDSEPERRPTLHHLVAARTVTKALALDDGAAAHFVGRRLSRIVSARPSARGYEVRRNGSQSIETALPTVRLAPPKKGRSQ
jgi:peptidase E